MAAASVPAALTFLFFPSLFSPTWATPDGFPSGEEKRTHFHFGSSLTMVGRNQVFSETREMPVVGGTGKLRLARGYALARTRSFNQTTGDATVEYDVYVMHH